MPSYRTLSINPEVGKLFCEQYDIPYVEITRGENKGLLKVCQPRVRDREALLRTAEMLRSSGAAHVADHGEVFCDAHDRTIITFSPYQAKLVTQHLADIVNVLGYHIEMFEPGIYGYGTSAFALWRNIP